MDGGWPGHCYKGGTLTWQQREIVCKFPLFRQYLCDHDSKPLHSGCCSKRMCQACKNSHHGPFQLTSAGPTIRRSNFWRCTAGFCNSPTKSFRWPAAKHTTEVTIASKNLTLELSTRFLSHSIHAFVSLKCSRCVLQTMVDVPLSIARICH